LDTVVRTLKVPVVRIEEVTTIAELRRQYPDLLFWFERHPRIAIGVTAATALVIGIVIFAFLRGIGAA
jgi:hypothetical protein